MTLGLVHLRVGNLDAAERELREALHISQLCLDERDYPIRFAETKATLARCLIRQGSFHEAERLLLHAVDLIRDYGKNSLRAQRASREGLVALYEAWGNPAEATRWRERPE